MQNASGCEGVSAFVEDGLLAGELCTGERDKGSQGHDIEQVWFVQEARCLGYRRIFLHLKKRIRCLKLLMLQQYLQMGLCFCS
jgi:hypothetical protein